MSDISDIFLFPGSLEELEKWKHETYKIISPENGFVRTGFTADLEIAEKELREKVKELGGDGVIRYMPIIYSKVFGHGRGETYVLTTAQFAAQGVPVKKVKEEKIPDDPGRLF